MHLEPQTWKKYFWEKALALGCQVFQTFALAMHVVTEAVDHLAKESKAARIFVLIGLLPCDWWRNEPISDSPRVPSLNKVNPLGSWAFMP